MKKMKNNKGFTLVELLAVIVVLAIVMGLAVVGISQVLDNTRKSAFATDAKTFIEGARKLVSQDESNRLLGVTTTNYAPACTTTGTNTVPIAIENIPTEKGTNQKSPYGSAYTAASKVVVIGTPTTGGCTYEYKIFLSDGTHKIGTADDPITESNVNADAVGLAS